jgi:CheY-like chemotaxis protein
MKLLIVEDEPALLEEMKSFLGKENYICETAANFNDADEKLSVYHYDVALIDITLPGGSGLGLAIVKRICDLHHINIEYQYFNHFHCFILLAGQSSNKCIALVFSSPTQPF